MGEAAKRRRKFDVLAGIAEGVVSRVPNLAPNTADNITKALHELLDGQDEPARNLRIHVQHYLIEAAEFPGRASRNLDAETMLTTEAAAELMQCSRPYVAMQIDNKKLAGASVTEGGHRRVPVSSVRAWIKERESKAKQSDYREAAAESGLYTVAEKEFVETKPRRRS